ncbi:hypothetical protein BC351_32220 [Paenibacillus ferrarius]|uniref:Uncharacterized protein n=1 Tax=Paenibacillus ferrarius TaxID=1469647 RepID=A0A1V4HFN0_9BACL|nr:hypothetical protein BC351_32220 [Paenibacillus ferrarius]
MSAFFFTILTLPGASGHDPFSFRKGTEIPYLTQNQLFAAEREVGSLIAPLKGEIPANWTT